MKLIIVLMGCLSMAPLYLKAETIQDAQPETYAAKSVILFKKGKTIITESMARAVFSAVGYDLGSAPVVRRGGIKPGDGYFESILKVNNVDVRLGFYGPGEYSEPHYHNEEEYFVVVHGGCDVWLIGEVLSVDEKGKVIKSLYEKPLYKRYGVGDIVSVPAKTIHCFVVDDAEGLCRHIPLEKTTTSVNRIPKLKIPESA